MAAEARVPGASRERAPAKVNLTLRVLGRRADGYHRLKSLVAFADLGDELSFVPGGESAVLAVDGPFASQCGPLAGNLVLRAAAAFAASTGESPYGRFRLTKNIPVAAGLGGGSADAAAALRLLARARGVAPGDPRVTAVAATLGADVPVCLSSHACVMTGIGEILSPPLVLPELHAVLVNPGIAVATQDVFAAYADAAAPAGPGDRDVIPAERDALIEFLRIGGNDLTAAAVACTPVIGEVLAVLGALPGAQLARMSGSGATCFALFASAEAAASAASRLSGGGTRWWAVPVTLGSASGLDASA